MAIESWRDRSLHVEAATFVGRRPEIDLVRGWLAGRGSARLLLIEGAAGVGKSALLRALARTTHESGVDATVCNATVGLPHQPVDPGNLVAIDDADAWSDHPAALVEALDGFAAPASTVVVAGRRLPGARHLPGVPTSAVRSVRLGPLSPTEVAELLVRRSVTATDLHEAVARWSRGYPAAVLRALEELASSGSFDPDDPRTDQRLLRDLVGDGLERIDPHIAEVAGIAPVLDTRLLAAALPGRPVRAGYRALALEGLAEPRAGRTTLHPLVRDVAGRELRRRAPHRHRELLLRVADHLRSRAADGEVGALFEMAELLGDSGLRIGLERSATHFADRVRPADLAVFEATAARPGASGAPSADDPSAQDPPAAEPPAAELATKDPASDGTRVDPPSQDPRSHPQDGPSWWTWVRWWVERCPELVVGVRRMDGTLVAIAVLALPDQLPEWGIHDPAVSPVLDHLLAAGLTEDTAVLFHLVYAPDAQEPAELAEIIRVGNMSGLERLPRLPRRAYVSEAGPRPEAGLDLLGTQEITGLRRDAAGRNLTTYVIDYGPGGMADRLHELIRAEHGLTAPPPPANRAAAILDALRHHRDDLVLAASSLGTGTGPVRVASVRAAVADALAAAFGDSDGDQLRRRALELAYVTPGSNSLQARQALHLSRSGYFRLLQRAREQLRVHVSSGVHPGAGGDPEVPPGVA